ncbi:MAG TPA: ABC transporter permease [Bacteroidales bacterium]|nr:ABC transporter permease [Bacteroidales bacterium]
MESSNKKIDDMILSDLKAAIRSIIRNRLPSAISILGLGIGLGSIILLAALVIHERSFDKFIPDRKNTYRILYGTSALTQYPLAEVMAGQIAGVRDFFRYYHGGNIQIRNSANEMVRDRNLAFADPSIFRIMGAEFINGGPAVTPSEIAISEESAMKYFGEVFAVGRILPVKFTDGMAELSVSGVYRNFPSNSTLDPYFVADIKLSEKIFAQFQKTLGDYGSDRSGPTGWSRADFLSYVVLDPNTDPATVENEMEVFRDFLTIENAEENQYSLQPVTDIYLRSEGITGGYFLRQGNPDELKYLEAVSLLILLISLANYILLSRAVMSDRVHETGTRKVYGASFSRIRMLIMTESVLLVLLSLIPAGFIIDFGIGFLNSTLNKTMTGEVFLNFSLWLIITGTVILIASIAGWLIGHNYSRIPALKLLSGMKLKPDGSARWNYSFLVLHFAIYMILVTGVLALSKQIRYLMTGYQGINPENVFVADLNSDGLKNSFTMICDEMRKVPGVVSVAGGSYIPPFNSFLPVRLAVTEGETVRFDGLIMGEGMTELLGIEVIEGSSFGPYKPGPPEILVNESTAKEYNVGAGDLILAFTVRGVLRDFHAHSMHSSIQPMVILPQNPARMSLIAVRTDGQNDTDAIARLRELFTTISPDEVFEIRYLTDVMEGFYQREGNQLRMIAAFSFLAVILSVMGLFGISMISILRRRKEIGIRKVNGASVGVVLLMLNIDFIKWVIAAALISVPVSVWLLDKWMERFAYRTDLNWWIYALAVLSAVVIALLTVSWQSWRAATRNPIEALRYE